MVEVIPSRLFWQAACSSPEAWSEGVDGLALCELSEDEEADRPTRQTSKYSVPHYSEKSLGRAFGPLALDQVLRFCHHLEQRLQQQQQQVYLYAGSGSEEDRINVLVCLGAYLALRLSWTPARIAQVLGQEDAERKFICSFAPSSRPEPPSDAMDALVASLVRVARHPEASVGATAAEVYGADPAIATAPVF